MSKEINGQLNGQMQRMELPLAELFMRGRELIRYLRRFGEQHWSEWLEDGLEIVRRDPHHGIATLLAGFEGIGSMADVYLCPEAGHRVSANDELAVNEQMLVHVSQVYQLARDLGDYIDVDALRKQSRDVRYYV